MQAISDCSE